ncbi:hypothetical protein BH09CHL1_BH09CHL1_31540 [soil metagenome]
MSLSLQRDFPCEHGVFRPVLPARPHDPLVNTNGQQKGPTLAGRSFSISSLTDHLSLSTLALRLSNLDSNHRPAK